MRGLPPEAAVWRTSAFPPQTELLAQLLELTDRWHRTMLSLQSARKGGRISVPAEVRILRPGDEPPKRDIEDDPRVLAAFFARHFK